MELEDCSGKALWWMAGFLLFVYTVPANPILGMFSMIILAFCTISLGYSAPGIATKILKDRDISYGVYMYHGMLLSILVEMNVIGNVYLPDFCSSSNLRSCMALLQVH